MAQKIKSFIVGKLSASAPKEAAAGGFQRAPRGELFPATDPAVDGDDCLHDCDSCSVRLPAKWKIDRDDDLYGHVNAWATHVLVATGKTDWVRDVADETGSVMEAMGAAGLDLPNGKLMLSASNMPLPDAPAAAEPADTPTTVLLLPSFTYIDNVTPRSAPALLASVVAAAPTNTTPLAGAPPPPPTLPPSAPFALRACPHRYLVLLCSQRTRDARCGQSAPLLRRELERHLRAAGLHRDAADARPGGAAVLFVSHVGGHKYSANVLVYRRADGDGGAGAAGAAQCIWLARVRPEDCENIVRYTLLQGKVVKPAEQLRGGFDRAKGLVSW